MFVGYRENNIRTSDVGSHDDGTNDERALSCPWEFQNVLPGCILVEKYVFYDISDIIICGSC